MRSLLPVRFEAYVTRRRLFIATGREHNNEKAWVPRTGRGAALLRDVNQRRQTPQGLQAEPSRVALCAMGNVPGLYGVQHTPTELRSAKQRRGQIPCRARGSRQDHIFADCKGGGSEIGHHGVNAAHPRARVHRRRSLLKR